MATPLTPEQRMQQRYKNIFSSAEGKLVLGDIATVGHIFEAVDPKDAVLNAERNFALVILQMAGAFDPLYPQLGLGQGKDK